MACAKAALAATAAIIACTPGATATFTVEVFGNSVMRGTPRCTVTLANGFNMSLDSLCPAVAPLGAAGVASARVTGTLAADADGWHRFAAQVDQLTWIRLWVDVSVLSHSCAASSLPARGKLLHTHACTWQTASHTRVHVEIVVHMHGVHTLCTSSTVLRTSGHLMGSWPRSCEGSDLAFGLMAAVTDIVRRIM